MEKVLVTREVAEDIEKIRGFGNDEILRCHVSDPKGWSHESLNGLPLDTLVRALYGGYEIEKTPEEKVREYYEWQKDEWRGYESDGNFSIRSAAHAIEYILDVYGIKIEGVNA